jgi:hypothetical protein
MDLYKQYGSDKLKTEEGVWVSLETKDLATEEQKKTEACVLLARSSNNNSHYRTELNKRMVKLRRGYRTIDKVPTDIQDGVIVETLGKCVLLDWVNHNDREGKPMPYSQKNATDLMQLLPEYRDDIADLSSDLDFYKENLEEDIKNSPAS